MSSDTSHPTSSPTAPGAVTLIRQVAATFVELVEANAAACDERAAVHRGDTSTLVTARRGDDPPETPPTPMWGSADAVRNFETYATRSREWAAIAREILDAPDEEIAAVTLDAVDRIALSIMRTTRQLDYPGAGVDFTLSDYDVGVRPAMLYHLLERLTQHLLGNRATRWVGATEPLEVELGGEGRFEPGDWWPQYKFFHGRVHAYVEATDPGTGRELSAVTDRLQEVGLFRPFELDDADAAARRGFFAAGGRVEVKLVKAGLDGERDGPPAGVGELSMENLCGLTKEQLVDYLGAAPVVLDAGTQVPDRVDPSGAPIPLAWHTDGLWVWSSETAAYVERHDLALPSYVLCHIATRAGVLPVLEPEVLDQARETVSGAGQ